MIGYFDVFPDKCETELRTVTLMDCEVGDPVPNGLYVFTEYFCNDLSCDCSRLLVKVFHQEDSHSRPEEVATISYTWNDCADESWSEIIGETGNPFLDPFHFQAGFADEIMDLWSEMLSRDRDYQKRIIRHYHELREKFGVQHPENSISPVAVPRETPSERKRRYKALQRRTASNRKFRAR
ncbi:MAG: hypothetical protein R3C53_05095 [Pirellulaceae bacterium]